jgi:hypothetical protein
VRTLLPAQAEYITEIPYSNLLSEKVVFKETPLEMVEKEAQESDKRPDTKLTSFH